jgi:DNA repair protein RadC
VGRFALLRFRPEKYDTKYFFVRNIPEAAPSSQSFSVSEKVAPYGSAALSGVEHLTLLVGKETIARTLIRHFGSLKTLFLASFQELRQFIPQRKAEAVMAALSMCTIAESEHARSNAFDNPESVYGACADMKLFTQEVLRVVLLDAKQRLITIADITKGSVNESLAHPREIFRPVIAHSAYSFILCRLNGYVMQSACPIHRVSCGLV